MNFGTNQYHECPDCLYPYYVAPIRSLPSCPYCGFEFTEEKDWQYWDQSLPGYSDAELKQFAVEATNYLIEEEYQKRRWNKYSIGWLGQQSKKWGKTDPEYIFDVRDCGTTFLGAGNVQINYNIQALRAKRHCGDTVAHESAHASPWVITGETEYKYVYLAKVRGKWKLKKSKHSWKGHHYLWQQEHQNFRSKIRARFPKYWGE